MKEIALPQGEEARKKKARALRRKRKFTNGAVFAVALVAIACLIGLLVAAIMLQTGEREQARDTVLYILTGSFTGGAVLFALAAFGLGVLATRIQAAEMDYLERMCGMDCFYVGDATVAQFCEKELYIRSESPDKKAKIHIPYREIRFPSVCTRKKPCGKGKRSAVIEVPSHYVLKRSGAPKAFTETDGKERLYRILQARGLELLRERPPHEGEKRPNTRYPATAKLLLPDADKRRRNLIIIGVNALIVIAGILVATFWRDMTLLGAILCVLGAVFVARGIAGYVQAKGILTLGKAGLYWKEGGNAAAERFFLKWEVIESVRYETIQDKRFIVVQCAFGAFHLPDIAGAYEAIDAAKPGICA